MSDPEPYDLFYAEARDRLLLQAFALTGDLPASRNAVRDAFVAAWHRWPKLRKAPDPEPWVRSYVLTHAHRRHTARIFHRDRGLDAELRATLDALHQLPFMSRKALVLADLSTASPEERAREVGLPLADAEQKLEDARRRFAEHRGIPGAEVRAALEQLGAHCAEQRWPRATIVRRAGTARRRTHALAGVALVTAAVLVSGFVVADAHGVRPTLESARDRITSVPTPPSSGPQPPSTEVVDSLLTTGQVAHALPGRSWRVTGTDPSQHDTLPCQRRRYADPRLETALVRNFTSGSGSSASTVGAANAAVQTTEYSRDVAAAKAGYRATTDWFATCTMPQVQLLGVRRVSALGDQAEQYAFRAWHQPVMTFVLGVARTGRVTTVAMTRTSGAHRPDLAANLTLLSAATDNLCRTTAGGTCSTVPKARTVVVPPAGRPAAMLSELDLPRIAGVDKPWMGTTPRAATQNLAATPCDESTFQGPGWRHAATRSFLIPRAHLATAFGLTETVGALTPTRAKSFVGHIRSELASCSDRHMGTKVKQLAGDRAVSVWRVRTQVSNKSAITYYMGVARHDGSVAQVGFVPDGVHTMTDPDFVALVRRAGDRVAALPSRR